ncbi:NUDIX hydrolase [Chengkuizengella sediminis]|uniref:NUDIX hydrolase n=1 Tax=Chengkuizengella sediminis TaxID=1885917 RepID=UPI00138A410F|nr:NUDIX domain-containing protein [Chengkuizengella sediminis]NDI33910.1 NUDIX domain-containing protein [Chengkuizengella sediminis]
MIVGTYELNDGKVYTQKPHTEDELYYIIKGESHMFVDENHFSVKGENMLELLHIFDEDMNLIGKQPRDKVHKKGYWHETFHCWITVREEEDTFLLFQKRASCKADYPNFLDITSAGHLLASETIKDGVREVEEELGLKVKFEELISIGIIKEEIRTEAIIDREFCHVYLYEADIIPKFKLQQEEVASIFKIKLDEVIELFEGHLSEIKAIEINNKNECKERVVYKKHILNDSGGYYQQIFDFIKKRN